jgi:hypothetical protein
LPCGIFSYLAAFVAECLSVFTSMKPLLLLCDRLCGPVVRVLGYRSGGPGSFPALADCLRSSWSGTGSTQPREYNRGATWTKQ